MTKKYRFLLLAIACVIGIVYWLWPNNNANNVSYNDSDFRFYEVNKRTSEFPQNNDFSTPESAYVAINQLMTEGGDWNRVHLVKSENPIMDTPSPEVAEKWRDTLIREVWIYENEYFPIPVACIIADVRDTDGVIKYDQRFLACNDNRWRNIGQDLLINDLDDARANFKKKSFKLQRGAASDLERDRWNRTN